MKTLDAHELERLKSQLHAGKLRMLNITDGMHSVEMTRAYVSVKTYVRCNPHDSVGMPRFTSLLHKLYRFLRHADTMVTYDMYVYKCQTRCFGKFPFNILFTPSKEYAGSHDYVPLEDNVSAEEFEHILDHFRGEHDRVTDCMMSNIWVDIPNSETFEHILARHGMLNSLVRFTLRGLPSQVQVSFAEEDVTTTVVYENKCTQAASFGGGVARNKRSARRTTPSPSPETATKVARKPITTRTRTKSTSTTKATRVLALIGTSSVGKSTVCAEMLKLRGRKNLQVLGADAVFSALTKGVTGPWKALKPKVRPALADGVQSILARDATASVIIDDIIPDSVDLLRARGVAVKAVLVFASLSAIAVRVTSRADARPREGILESFADLFVTGSPVVTYVSHQELVEFLMGDVSRPSAATANRVAARVAKRMGLSKNVSSDSLIPLTTRRAWDAIVDMSSTSVSAAATKLFRAWSS